MAITQLLLVVIIDCTYFLRDDTEPKVKEIYFFKQFLLSDIIYKKTQNGGPLSFGDEIWFLITENIVGTVK